MKRIILSIFSVCFFLSLLISIIFSDKKNNKISERENRYLAKLPSARFYSNEYKSQLSDWLGDRVFLRDSLIDLKTNINDSFFNIVPLSFKVCYGKDGMLFHRGDNHIDIAEGKYPLSNSDLEAIANNHQKISDYYKKLGKKYIFCISPSKASIYPEYLGKNYSVRESPCDIVNNYVKNHTDVTVIDMKSEFLKHKDGDLLFFKDDTHWSPLGDYCAYCAIIETLGLENKLKPFDTVQKNALDNEFGDLTRRLGIKRKNYLYTDIVYDYSSRSEKTPFAQKIQEIHDKDFIPEEDLGAFRRCIVLENPKIDAKPKILVYADSQFCSLEKKLAWMLGENFSKAVFIWSYNEQSAKLAEETDCDYILYCMTERFLNTHKAEIFPEKLSN